jgi:hypothetical protein
MLEDGKRRLTTSVLAHEGLACELYVQAGPPPMNQATATATAPKVGKSKQRLTGSFGKVVVMINNIYTRIYQYKVK